MLVYTMAWKFPLTFSLIYTSALESCHTHTQPTQIEGPAVLLLIL